MAATAVRAVIVSDDPRVYEDEHVHLVYDEIAPHFSSTRYKPWPIIAQFLSSLPTGWVGLDSGTGNGKYLPLPLDRPGSLWTIGLDRSRSLLEIAQNAGSVRREVLLGNVLDVPWRTGAFDYAISIATIHHLSTHARRRLAVQRLLKCLNPSHGRALVYVWAIEQDALSKRSIPTDSYVDSMSAMDDVQARGQDVLVPWVLSPQKYAVDREASWAEEPSCKILNRYYHMFAQGELSQSVREAAQDLGLVVGKEADAKQQKNGGMIQGIEITQDGWERSNYYVEVRRWECSR